MTVAHFEPLQELAIETAPSMLQKPAAATAARLRFDAFGRTFDLRLTRNDRLLSAGFRRSGQGSATAYRGEIAGNPDSWARIVVAGGLPRGMIWDGSELYAVEAPGDSAVAAGSAVIWRLADAWVPPGAMSCGASAGSGNAARWFGAVVTELGKALAKAPGANSQINLGMIGDFQFFTDKGVDSDVAILTRMNNVDGIYSEQLAVQINVEELEIFTSEAEPFSDTTAAGDLLDEVAAYRSRTSAQRAQGLTHLFTGRELDGGTVGVAFTDVLCSRNAGAGLTEANHSPTFDSLIAAHEIGHNFGAPHDGEAGSPCVAETGSFLMAPNLNGSDRFSQCSIDEIRPRIAAASCILPLPTVDLTVDVEGFPEQAFLGNQINMRSVATNVGTELAENAEMTILLPDTLTLSPDQVTQVSCTDDGAGFLTCPLGAMAGGSALTASVRLIATGTGSGELIASVTADADDNPNNNVEIAPISVVPAVDLTVDAIAATQMNLNQSRSAGVALSNLSVLGATNVQLTVTFDAALRPDSAAWPLGACTVALQEIECAADSFAPQSGTTLDFGFTGTAAGQASYTISVTSVEADADASNNSSTASVTVTDPSASSAGDEGGGGVFGPAWLLLLLGARHRRSERRRTKASGS